MVAFSDPMQKANGLWKFRFETISTLFASSMHSPGQRGWFDSWSGTRRPIPCLRALAKHKNAGVLSKYLPFYRRRLNKSWIQWCFWSSLGRRFTLPHKFSRCQCHFCFEGLCFQSRILLLARRFWWIHNHTCMNSPLEIQNNEWFFLKTHWKDHWKEKQTNYSQNTQSQGVQATMNCILSPIFFEFMEQ